MKSIPNILDISSFLPLLYDEVNILQEVNRQVPGSVKYSINRYRKQPNWQIEDSGMLIYHFDLKHPEENHLELRFCVSGNYYCREKLMECDRCKFSESSSCIEKIESVDVLSFIYSPSYLNQFAKSNKNDGTLIDTVVSFSHNESFNKIGPLCSKTTAAIQALLNHNYTDTRENIFINAQTQIILLYTTDNMLSNKDENLIHSKFLNVEEDRVKIINAREILLQHICEPITIKALSRKVAINECYLKKGFKEIFGTTIFDFYQNQRMEHAKYLLYNKHLSVTEVSSMLGYSSISHFSTAFKKHTGIKPCELLMHQ
jgi:AraC-like DNA-binding protein